MEPSSRDGTPRGCRSRSLTSSRPPQQWSRISRPAEGELDLGQIVQALRDLGMGGAERLLTNFQRLLVQGRGFGVAAKEIDRDSEIIECFCEAGIFRMEAFPLQLQRPAMQRL